MADATSELQEMTDFGVFYPRGHLVGAFPRREDAERVRRDLRAAEAGSTFLVIYAPGDLEAERAMKVVRRVPFDFVHRYQRFSIQVMR